MKKITLLIFFLLPIIMQAQHAGGNLASKDYILYGETEVVMKDGTKITCTDKINGTKIGKTDIDYQDVDYIVLVKTITTGHSSHNGNRYKYVPIGKNKVRLMLIINESDKLSLYQQRPTLTGGGLGPSGHVKSDGQHSVYYMIRDGNPIAIKVDLGNKLKKVSKYFQDCPRVLKHIQNKESQFFLDKYNIISNFRFLKFLYNKGCDDPSPQEIKEDLDEYYKIRDTL